MARELGVLILLGLTAGCAARGPIWEKQGLNKADFDRDMRECNWQGANAVGWKVDSEGRPSPPCFSWGCFSDDIATAAKESEAVKMSCMKGLGYTWR
jgi:hypothetical protein